MNAKAFSAIAGRSEAKHRQTTLLARRRLPFVFPPDLRAWCIDAFWLLVLFAVFIAFLICT